MMNSLHRSLLALFLVLVLGQAWAESEASPGSQEVEPISSKFLEQQIQSLNWEQFKHVVHAVPKLRAEVDAYGPLGWQYVERNYRRYAWSRSINKMEAERRQELQGLIDQVRNGK